MVSLWSSKEGGYGSNCVIGESESASLRNGISNKTNQMGKQKRRTTYLGLKSMPLDMHCSPVSGVFMADQEPPMVFE